jgi:hypothetical protein
VSFSFGQNKNKMAYEAEWRDYRKRRRLFWIVWLTYIPGVIAIALPLQYLFASETPIYFVALGWMAAFFLSGWRLGSWPCPRCGKWFFAKWWYGNLFARRCVHCKLPKWETVDSEKDATQHSLQQTQNPRG